MGKDNNRILDKAVPGPLDRRTTPFAKREHTHRRPSLSGVKRLGEALDAVLLTGAAVMFGFTRDGGALCLTILDGAERHRTYCASDEEIAETFASVEDYYNSLAIN